MMRRVMCGVVGVCLVATLALARPGVVKTKDGQSIAGDVAEQEDSVMIVLHGVKTVISRDKVMGIEYPPPFEEQFQARRAKLDARDVAGRIQLAQMAFDHQRYDWAQQMLEESLAIDPNNRQATDLLDTVHGQMKLVRGQKSAAALKPAAAGPVPMVAGGRAVLATPLLNADEINTIRQAELKASDTNVHFQFDNDVRQKYAAAKAIQVNMFLARRPFEQAWKILTDGDAALRKDVRVQDDPASLREYRVNIQNMVLAGCAAMNCHGSVAGGSLILNRRADFDAATYTNFYILQKYAKPVAVAPSNIFSKSGTGLIDRVHPEQSLLAQYGLPASQAEQHHPEVPGFKPVFTGKNDARYHRLITWMGSSLQQAPADYGISLQTAAEAPASRPTSQESNAR